jgi:hypothetical protein
VGTKTVTVLEPDSERPDFTAMTPEQRAEWLQEISADNEQRFQALTASGLPVPNLGDIRFKAMSALLFPAGTEAEQLLEATFHLMLGDLLDQIEAQLRKPRLLLPAGADVERVEHLNRQQRRQAARRGG